MFFVIPAYTQNFMMNMDVRESTEDTVISYSSIQVIWGIKNDTICFIWGEYIPMCFTRVGHGKRPPKAVRESIHKYLEKLERMERKQRIKNTDVRIRGIFYNKWGEVFLIVVYMNKGALIFINRLNGPYLSYSFKMTLKHENYE